MKGIVEAGAGALTLGQEAGGVGMGRLSRHRVWWEYVAPGPRGKSRWRQSGSGGQQRGGWSLLCRLTGEARPVLNMLMYSFPELIPLEFKYLSTSRALSV